MSLISAIYDAIFTETPSDVSVTERSFISVMLDANNQKEAFSKDDFRLHLSKGKSLVLTRFLVQLVVKSILGVIWLIYGIYNVIHKIITGRWRGMKSSSGINLVIGSMVLVITIMALLYILAFLTKEVVLSPNNARINDKGVITVDQPCLETHSFFLLNAATFWTSTDIQVTEGDNVMITASGSMYSDIDDMYKAAYLNKELEYPRNVFAPNVTYGKDADAKYCVYGRGLGDKNPQFGSLLYQICNTHTGPVPYNNNMNLDVVKQMDFYNKNNEYKFTAENSGVLYLAFNDILLDTLTYNVIYEDCGDMKNRLDTIGFTKNDCENNSEIWFQDNLGEVLVNVRIEKKLCNSDLPWYKKPVVRIVRHLNSLSTKGFFGSSAWINILIIMLWLGVDVIISNRIKKVYKV